MKHVIQLGVASVLLLQAGITQAGSDNFYYAYQTVGTADCWAYTDSPINQMGSSSIASMADGANTVVNGPDSAFDADSSPESATITRVNATTVSFSSSADIFFAVLKSGDRVEILYYLAGEVATFSDSNMYITIDDVGLPIEAVSLCYSSGGAAEPPEPDILIPQCSSCSGGDTALICGFKLDAPHFAGGTNECCVCGSPSLLQCNPSAPAGEAGSCLGDPDKPKAGLKIPTHIEFNKDPYVCTTSGGVRRCYKY